MLTTHRCFGCGWTALAQYQGFIYFSYSVPPVSVLRIGEKLGGNMTETADPDSPKGYSETCNILLGNKNWGRGRSILMILVSLGGFVLGSQGSCYLEEGWTSVSLWEVVSDFLFFSFHGWNCLYLDPQVFWLCSFPSCWWGWGVNSRCVGAWQLAGVDSQQKYREQMVFGEVSKWAVVFCLLWLRSTGAEVTWSPLVTEFGLCSFAKFRWSELWLLIDNSSSGSSTL